MSHFQYAHCTEITSQKHIELGVDFQTATCRISQFNAKSQKFQKLHLYQRQTKTHQAPKSERRFERFCKIQIHTVVLRWLACNFGFVRILLLYLQETGPTRKKKKQQHFLCFLEMRGTSLSRHYLHFGVGHRWYHSCKSSGMKVVDVDMSSPCLPEPRKLYKMIIWWKARRIFEGIIMM